MRLTCAKVQCMWRCKAQSFPGVSKCLLCPAPVLFYAMQSLRHPGTEQACWLFCLQKRSARVHCVTQPFFLHFSALFGSPPSIPRTNPLWMSIKHEALTFLFFQPWLPQDMPHLGGFARVPRRLRACSSKIYSCPELESLGIALIQGTGGWYPEIWGRIYVARYHSSASGLKQQSFKGYISHTWAPVFKEVRL